MTKITSQIDYDKIRERFESGNGNAYWRGLEELANSPEFQEKVSKEFPGEEDRWTDPVARRTFLQVMGASLALSGLAGCTGFTKPKEHILPYLKQPEQMVLGKALFFASAATLNGYGFPILVESHEGRPTKIEGNPEAAASLGGASAWMQATVLDMYDPDRSQTTKYLGEPRDWAEFVDEIQKTVSALPNGGEGLAILTETVTSPSFADTINKVLAKYPSAKWYQYEPTGHENVREGARLAFGEYADTVYDIGIADVVLALDSDFTVEGPGALRYARQLADRRRVTGVDSVMNRFYSVESSPTMSGTLADHRFKFKPSQIEGVARAIAAKLGIAGAGTVPAEVEAKRQVIDTIVTDLQSANGKAVVIAGQDQPAVVHALVHAINAKLGAVGITVRHLEAIEARPTNQKAEIKALVQSMNEGKVSVLAILGGNPAYNAPADLKFKEALKKVKFAVHNSEYQDETSEFCAWHIAAPHYLETWGDVRAFDGTVTLVQPLIAPLFSSHASVEILTAVEGSGVKSPYEVLQNFWKTRWTGNFEKSWRKALHDGYVAESSSPVKNVTAKSDETAFPVSEVVEGLEIAIRPDPSVLDGRFANNAWLQELPKPFTKITWDNTVLMSLKTALKLGVKNEDVVKLTVNGTSVEGPVYITMGHCHDAVTVHLGYGRTKSGRVAMTEDDSFFTPRGMRLGIVDFVGTKPRGFNAYTLLTADSKTVGLPVKLERTKKTYELASTQIHFSLDDNDVRPDRDIPVVGEAFSGLNGENSSLTKRGIIRRGTLQEFKKYETTQENNAKENHGHEEGQDHHGSKTFAASIAAPHDPDPQNDLYHGAWKYEGYAWGMAIDTSVCNGCNACIIACQSENNVPVVGKSEIRRQHEMHWLRIDQYYSGNIDEPTVTNQPLPCMHCENAPCEVVCPVAATVHSSEGLNDMVYNRCVGTRFCSNNCPYKVRRFNWFWYTEHMFKSPLAKMVNNPDVTVRSRGVMEKCTYCVQRINSARIEAENESRSIRDGDIVTACEATCPTNAIVFGDINDKNSRVSKLRASSLHYGLLTELNTKPRTTYMVAISNPNPEIVKES